MKKQVMLGSIVASSFLLAGCFHQPASESTGQVTAPASVVPAETGVASPQPTADLSTAEQVNYTIDAKNFSFTPNKLEVTAGETIRVKLNNAGGTHDLVIDELGIRSRQLKDGESQVIEITAPISAAGQSYEFYCSVNSHRKMGMTGTITVK